MPCLMNHPIYILLFQLLKICFECTSTLKDIPNNFLMTTVISLYGCLANLNVSKKIPFTMAAAKRTEFLRPNQLSHFH